MDPILTGGHYRDDDLVDHLQNSLRPNEQTKKGIKDMAGQRYPYFYNIFLDREKKNMEAAKVFWMPMEGNGFPCLDLSAIITTIK